MEADYENKESSRRPLAAILLTLIPGVAVCAEEMAGQEQNGRIQKKRSRRRTGKTRKSSILCRKDRDQCHFELATGTGNLCGFRHRYGHEQRGSTLCQKSRRTKISGEYYERF